MADRLAEMEVRTLSHTLAVLDANALVVTLTERLEEVVVNTIGNKYFQVGGSRAGGDTVWVARKRLA